MTHTELDKIRNDLASLHENSRTRILHLLVDYVDAGDADTIARIRAQVHAERRWQESFPLFPATN